jgi:hypothetical protein
MYSRTDFRQYPPQRCSCGPSWQKRLLARAPFPFERHRPKDTAGLDTQPNRIFPNPQLLIPAIVILPHHHPELHAPLLHYDIGRLERFCAAIGFGQWPYGQIESGIGVFRGRRMRHCWYSYRGVQNLFILLCKADSVGTRASQMFRHVENRTHLLQDRQRIKGEAGAWKPRISAGLGLGA